MPLVPLNPGEYKVSWDQLKCLGELMWLETGSEEYEDRDPDILQGQSTHLDKDELNHTPAAHCVCVMG